MEKIIIPYFNIYASDFKAFKDKLTSDEFIQVIDAISDICLFGDSDFTTENKFQMMFFLKLKESLLKNIPKYKASIENGKKGGRPRKNKTNHKTDWEEMLEFFDYKCICCGTKMSKENPPTKDHIIPKSLGGSDEIFNLQPLCRECNASKCADHTTDYRLKYNIPDDLKYKWGISQKKPVGFLNNNPNETQPKPIKENKIKDNIIENNIKKIDPYNNKYLDLTLKLSEKHLGYRPRLGTIEVFKIAELVEENKDYEDIIEQAIISLKNINWENIDFKPSLNWLLKENNFYRLLNGEFDKKEEKGANGWTLV